MLTKVSLNVKYANGKVYLTHIEKEPKVEEVKLMNRKQMKVIRRKAKTIIVEWLQSLLPKKKKIK